MPAYSISVNYSSENFSAILIYGKREVHLMNLVHLVLLLSLLKTIFLWTAENLLYVCTVHKKVGGPQKVWYVQNAVVLNVIRDFVGILRWIVFISIIIFCKFVYCYYLLIFILLLFILLLFILLLFYLLNLIHLVTYFEEILYIYCDYTLLYMNHTIYLVYTYDTNILKRFLYLYIVIIFCKPKYFSSFTLLWYLHIYFFYIL